MSMPKLLIFLAILSIVVIICAGFCFYILRKAQRKRENEDANKDQIEQLDNAIRKERSQGIVSGTTIKNLEWKKRAAEKLKEEELKQKVKPTQRNIFSNDIEQSVSSEDQDEEE